MMKASFDKSHVEVIEKTPCYEGFFTLSKFKVKHKLFNGGWGNTLQRELFERGEAAAVLLYDPKLDLVVLTEQFRVGALNEASPWIYELVAGMIEEGETPESVAIRETQEESGAHVQELTPICQYLVSSGGTDEKIHVFMALLDSTHVGGIHGLSSEGEDIRVHKVTSQEAFEAVKCGKINNAATIIALQWLELNFKQIHRSIAGK